MAEPEKKPAAAAAAPAAAGKPAAPAATDKGGKKGKSITGSIITACVVLTVVAFLFISIGMGYVAAILVIGMLPGVASLMVDRRPGKFASKTVMAFNMSGMMPHLAAMVYSNDPNGIAKALFDDPMTWLWIYMFAAFGWLVIHLLPQISFLLFSVKAEYKMKRIRSFQNALVKEWGEEITK